MKFLLFALIVNAIVAETLQEVPPSAQSEDEVFWNRQRAMLSVSMPAPTPTAPSVPSKGMMMTGMGKPSVKGMGMMVGMGKKDMMMMML
jgi:hypothetical protein